MSDGASPTIGDTIDALERFYGRGATYSRAEREAILAGRVPEWLQRIARYHPSDEWRNHCANLIGQLEIAWRDGLPAVLQSAPLGKITKNVSASPPKLSADVRKRAGKPRDESDNATPRDMRRGACEKCGGRMVAAGGTGHVACRDCGEAP